MNTLPSAPKLSPMQLIDMGDLNPLLSQQSPGQEIINATAKNIERTITPIDQEPLDRPNQA